MANATAAAARAFRESYTISDAPEALSFGAPSARQLRYALLWATYENSVYRDIHLWSRKYKADFDLYRYTRGIHNPAFRLGEFYATYLWGGALDGDCGDGTATPSAIPIRTDSDALRESIAWLWEASNWPQRKATVPRWGSVLGDVGIVVRCDPARDTVTLEPVHPATLRDVVRDGMGHVKAYVIEERRPDPRMANGRLLPMPTWDSAPTVTYTEIVTRDGDEVVYQTFLDQQPWDWSAAPTEQRDAAPEWSLPYGFVPLVVIPHLDTGLGWGWSELHAGLGKFREVDDIASKLHDQIRKAVDPIWLFSGVTAPASSPSAVAANPTPQRPTPGRNDMPALYGPVGATAEPLVAPLDIEAVGQRMDALMVELAQDYPELDRAIWEVGAAASGASRREARKRVEARVYERRAGYDAALVRAQQMAVAIGGYHGITGYAGFGLDSYGRGDLEHAIGDRPVFQPDPIDKTEIDAAFWQAATAAVAAGYPLVCYLKDNGWSEERIAAIGAAKQAATPPQLQPFRIPHSSFNQSPDVPPPAGDAPTISEAPNDPTP